VTLAGALCLGACGEAAPPPAPPVNVAQAIDADPLALLPPGPAALGTVDARAFYASGSTGAQVASLVEGFLPLGPEVGFSAGRDIDRMAGALYAGAGLEAVSVVSGRFDVNRIQAAAAAHAPTHTGAPLVGLPYAGHTLYTVSNFAFTPLTDHTLVAGNEAAVRRVLDRLAAGGPQAVPRREVADWMLATIQTPGSSYALAADMAAIPPVALRGLPLPPGMTALTRVGVTGDFSPPGLNVAGTLSYADPQHAGAGADSLRQVAAFMNVASNLGAAPRVQNLAINTDGVNVGCRFALDEEAMKRTLGSIMKLVAPAQPLPPQGPPLQR